MMATGLAEGLFNTADVFSPDADADAIAAFYAARGLRYGVRVPAGMAWSHGTRVLRLRLMYVRCGALRPVESPPGVDIEAVAPRDLEEVVAVDSAAFGSERATVEPWIAGLVRAPDDAVTVACARRAGSIVGVGYAIHATGAGGRSVGIGGIGVAPEARRRGGIGGGAHDLACSLRLRGGRRTGPARGRRRARGPRLRASGLRGDRRP